MECLIRLAQPSDLKVYTDLLQVVYQSAYTNDKIGLTPDCFSKEIFATKDTQKYLELRLVNTVQQKTWLTFAGAKIVGSVSCIIKSNDEAELAGFYVDPKYQGKGLGKQLYNMALKFAGNRDLLLDIYTHNAKAIEMYKKWGWKLDKSRGEDGYFARHWNEWPQGVEAKCMYMRLKQRSTVTRKEI